MGNIFTKLAGYKTYVLGAAAILAAIGGYLGQSLNLTQLIEAIFAALGTMTIRHGITTTVSDATNKKL